MAKCLITESDVRNFVAQGKREITLPPGAIVTPLAVDFASSHKIAIIRSRADKSAVGLTGASQGRLQPPPANGGETVAFGADHGGFQLKSVLIKYAEGLGFSTLDLGTGSEDPCDYPDYAYAVARAVSLGKAWRGIMIDGVGIGSCVAANKVPGIRAGCCSSELVARNARQHNDTNVLTLGSRVLGIEACKAVMKVWLETPFAGGRHKGRIDKITDIEQKYSKIAPLLFPATK